MHQWHKIITSYATIRLNGKLEKDINDQPSCFYLSEPQHVVTPIGELMLDGVIVFDGDKGIESCHLSVPQLIHTPVGKLIAKSTLYFHSSKLRSVMLSVPQQINTPNGYLMVDGQISFLKDGKLADYKIHYPQSYKTPIGNLNVTDIRFSKNAQVISCFLSEPQRVNTPHGYLLVEGMISFNNDGILADYKIHYPQSIETPIGSLNVKYHYCPTIKS